LGVNNDNNDAPNETLKEMLNEYLKGYNELFEMAEKSRIEI
jgi:hypothetical protein